MSVTGRLFLQGRRHKRDHALAWLEGRWNESWALVSNRFKRSDGLSISRRGIGFLRWASRLDRRVSSWRSRTLAASEIIGLNSIGFLYVFNSLVGPNVGATGLPWMIKGECRLLLQRHSRPDVDNPFLEPVCPHPIWARRWIWRFIPDFLWFHCIEDTGSFLAFLVLTTWGRRWVLDWFTNDAIAFLTQTLIMVLCIVFWSLGIEHLCLGFHLRDRRGAWLRYDRTFYCQRIWVAS